MVSEDMIFKDLFFYFIFFFLFFFFFCILVSMATNKKIRTEQQNLRGRGPFKEHFYKSFDKISAMA